MTLQELRYLVAVAREWHCGCAAEKGFVSQRSLSVGIKHLEEELGVAIVARTRQEVQVAGIAAEIVAQARRALEVAARVRQIAIAGRDQLQRLPRFGVVHTITRYALPGLVAVPLARVPVEPLEIGENQTDNLNRMLREDRFDVAWLALPCDALGIEIEAVCDEACAVVVPAKQRGARCGQVAAVELHDEKLLLLSVGDCLRDQVLEASARMARPNDSGRQDNSLQTLRSMVAFRLGITVLPATALTGKYASPLLRAVPFKAPVPTQRVALAWRRGFHRPRAVALPAELLRGLPLPNAAGADDMSNARGRHAGG